MEFWELLVKKLQAKLPLGKITSVDCLKQVAALKALHQAEAQVHRVVEQPRLAQVDRVGLIQVDNLD